MHIVQCLPCSQWRKREKPNWARVEYKRAKQESREPDLRWGADAAQPLVDFPTIESQQHQGPSEESALKMNSHCVQLQL